MTSFLEVDEEVRSITFKKFSSTRFGPPKEDWLRRVIGTLDIDGNGTKHPVERQTDPFIFLDEATLPQGIKPPFGKHPHTGLFACTIQLSKIFHSMLWDNQRGIMGHFSAAEYSK